MAQTVLEETRNVLYIGGEQIYRIAVTCTSQGELKDTGLFVLEIVDDLDPQQDVFVRIANIADIESDDAYENNRTDAVAAGSSYWRSHYFEKDYDDIEVATAAVQAVFDRVNLLVSDYDTYINSFETTPTELLYFPSSTASEIDTLKATYDTSYTDYQTAVTTEATALGELQQSETDLTNAESNSTEWQDFQTAMTERLNEMGAARDALVNLDGDGVTFLGAVDTFIGAFDVAYPTGGTIPTARTALGTARDAYNTNGHLPAQVHINEADQGVTNHGGTKSDVDTKVLEKAALVTSAQSDVTDKQIAYNTAKGDTQTAYTTLETAYNAVKVVCPNWSPTNPFPPLP